jgi:hypothetical protein
VVPQVELLEFCNWHKKSWKLSFGDQQSYQVN